MLNCHKEELHITSKDEPYLYDLPSYDLQKLQLD